MLQARYSHSGTFIDNKLYIVGGRYHGNNKNLILKQCEYFDFETWRWYAMCPLIKERSNGYIIYYNQELYVIGGYSSSKKFERIIEKYDSINDQWIAL